MMKALFFVFVFVLYPLAVKASVLNLPKQEHQLKNGLKVFLVKYPSPGAVAYQIAVHAGSRNEVEKGKSGFAHFFEHLMFRGTKKRSSKEFGDLYAKLGCENNAWTSYDETVYHGVVAKDYLAKVLEAEADRFANLSFDEKALKDEAGAVLGEYHKDVAQPEFVLEENMMAMAFEKHTYGHTTMGYKEDILKFTERFTDVWPFFKNYYRPSNVAVVLVGDIDFDRSLAMVEKHFGSWKDVKVEEPAIAQEPEQKEARFKRVSLDKPTQKRVSVAYKTPAFSTKNSDSAALVLAAEVLFSSVSDFQKEYRFKKRWIDAVSYSPTEWAHPALWSVTVRLTDDGSSHEKEVREKIQSLIEKLATSELDNNELEKTKKRFRNMALTGWFGAPDELASKVAWYTNYETDLDVLDRVLGRIGETTPKTIQAFAAKNLVAARRNVIVLEGK